MPISKSVKILLAVLIVYNTQQQKKRSVLFKSRVTSSSSLLAWRMGKIVRTRNDKTFAFEPDELRLDAVDTSNRDRGTPRTKRTSFYAHAWRTVKWIVLLCMGWMLYCVYYGQANREPKNTKRTKRNVIILSHTCAWSYRCRCDGWMVGTIVCFSVRRLEVNPLRYIHMYKAYRGVRRLPVCAHRFVFRSFRSLLLRHCGYCAVLDSIRAARDMFQNTCRHTHTYQRLAVGRVYRRQAGRQRQQHTNTFLADGLRSHTR